MINTTTNLKTVQGKGLTSRQLDQIDLLLFTYRSLTSHSVRTCYDVYTERFSVYLIVRLSTDYEFEAPISAKFKTQLSASVKAKAVREYIDARQQAREVNE